MYVQNDFKIAEVQTTQQRMLVLRSALLYSTRGWFLVKLVVT